MVQTEAQKRATKKYKEKMKRIIIDIKPEEARDIKDCAALAGLSVTRYLIKCHENYQQGK